MQTRKSSAQESPYARATRDKSRRCFSCSSGVFQSSFLPLLPSNLLTLLKWQGIYSCMFSWGFVDYGQSTLIKVFSPKSACHLVLIILSSSCLLPRVLPELALWGLSRRQQSFLSQLVTLSIFRRMGYLYNGCPELGAQTLRSRFHLPIDEF